MIFVILPYGLGTLGKRFGFGFVTLQNIDEFYDLWLGGIFDLAVIGVFLITVLVAIVLIGALIHHTRIWYEAQRIELHDCRTIGKQKKEH